MQINKSARSGVTWWKVLERGQATTDVLTSPRPLPLQEGSHIIQAIRGRQKARVGFRTP